MPHHYITLFLAILAETVGTTALNASQQFTRPLPTALMAVSYGLSFWLLSLTLKFMPVGVVYAIWSGLGVVLIALIGLWVFGQKLDLAAVLGIAMIIGGVLVMHLFSNATGH